MRAWAGPMMVLGEKRTEMPDSKAQSRGCVCSGGTQTWRGFGDNGPERTGQLGGGAVKRTENMGPICCDHGKPKEKWDWTRF